MNASHDIKMGKAILRVMPVESAFKGTVILDGKLGAVLEDDDEARLIARLRNEAGKLSPNYFGFDGAIARFKEFFPNGFSDPAYVRKERDYKLDARQRLNDGCSLEAVVDGTFNKDAAKRAYQTNMLSVYEAARVREVIASPEGEDFIRGAAELAIGDAGKGLVTMARAIAPHGRASWPIVTYLPFLWAPENHIFLKPEATIDFAERVGHPFASSYDSELTPDVYRALLDLARATKLEIAPLEPIDGIDVQSFIWVVGAYNDDDIETAG